MKAMPYFRTFQWGVDSVHHVKFNQVETNLLGAAASDNSIILYDIRNVGPVRKVVMNLRSNALAWNPMEVGQFSDFPPEFQGCGSGSGRIRTFLVGAGSGKFSPDPDPIGTFAMLSCQ